MNAYVITTGIVFGLIILGHVWRVADEGWRLATEPSFVLTTALAMALFVWSGCLLWLARRSRPRKD